VLSPGPVIRLFTATQLKISV